MQSIAARQQILLEYSGLGPESCPLGIYVIPMANDPFTWHGVQFIHKGYFASAVLKFRLEMPSDYPATAPSVTYQGTAIVHPLIDPATSRVKLDARFPTWRPRQDYICHVLHFLKAMFKRRELDRIRENICANREAYSIYRDQTDLFARLASQTAALSITENALFSQDVHTPSTIKFRPLDSTEEEDIQARLEARALERIVASRSAAP